MKKLAKRITGKEWGMIVLTILFTCFSVYLELEVPTYISQITELLGTSGTQLGELWSPAAKMIGLSLLAFFSSVMVGFFAARVAASYTTHLRRDVFHRVLDFSHLGHWKNPWKIGILALGGPCGCYCQRLDDHSSHDSGLSKTIGHPKINR